MDENNRAVQPQEDKTNQNPVTESGKLLPEQSEQRTNTKRSYLVIILVIIAVVIIALGSWYLLAKKTKPVTSNAPPIRIGLSMATLTVARWPVEEAIMQKQAAASGATVIAYNANNNTATQISQIENLIVQKVSVIIIVANDTTLLAPVTQMAKDAGIKVIAYDRLIEGTGTSEYISFSSDQVGVDWANYIVSALPASLKTANVAFIEGPLSDSNVPRLKDGVMSVLSPLISSGKINLVFDQNIDNWDPGLAFSAFKTFMANGTRVDAVIGDNDELANSAISVLQPLGLVGKIPVVGQDGELAAVQRIESGSQSLTAYKPGYLEANMAIKDAIALSRGQKIESNATRNNGSVNVNSYLFTPIAVTKANVDSVFIKVGVYTSGQIFGSVPTTK